MPVGSSVVGSVVGSVVVGDDVSGDFVGLLEEGSGVGSTVGRCDG